VTTVLGGALAIEWANRLRLEVRLRSVSGVDRAAAGIRDRIKRDRIKDAEWLTEACELAEKGLWEQAETALRQCL